MRSNYTMTNGEALQFNRLRPYLGEAIAFWTKAARARGLDPKSVISEGHNGKFTALPKDHGKNWNYPSALKCKKRVVYKD